MNFIKEFNIKNIIKVFLITLSMLFWVYFYVASNVNLDIIIIFDLPSIINTFFTWNFLVFLLVFPLTSALIIAYSFKGDLKTNILLLSTGIFLGALISVLVFKLNFYFVLFFGLYLLTHIVICFLTKNKFENDPKKSIFNISNNVTSKLALFLTIILFIVIFLAILPNQKEDALSMEAGVVNLFVGDDLSNWLGTSLSISKTCTSQNLEQIMKQPQYKALKYKTDIESVNFTKLMDSFYKSTQNGSTEDLNEFADLDSLEIKENVLTTIRQMPIMLIVEKYFAFIFAFVIISFAYLYFSLAFGLIGILLVFGLRKFLDLVENNGSKKSPESRNYETKFKNIKKESEDLKKSLENKSNDQSVSVITNDPITDKNNSSIKDSKINDPPSLDDIKFSQKKK